MTLRPPLIVCGPMRCGKTTLCRILDQSPDVCHWSEPNALWRTGHAYRADHTASEADAKPAVIRHMRRVCARYQAEHAGKRLIMEGPLACLKVAFLAKVFPDAKFVLVVGHGGASLPARVVMDDAAWRYRVNDSKTIDRWKGQLAQTWWWEIPAMAPTVLSGVLRRYSVGGKPRWAGLRYPGWKADRGRLTGEEIAAKQWVACVETARRDLAALPANRRLEVRIEDCMAAPEERLRELVQFCGIDPPPGLIDHGCERLNELKKIADSTPPDAEMLERVMPIMGPALRELGYSDPIEGSAPTLV